LAWEVNISRLIDPEITRSKFDREIAAFSRYREMYAQRGCFIVGCEFPEIKVIFCATKLTPPAVVFGALMNFDSYDLLPPSVKLADPFTFVPYKANELPTKLEHRLPAGTQMNIPDFLGPLGAQLPPGFQVQFQPVHAFMQSFDPEGDPFICMPGIREYHECPAHT
jgi:hypothetical protein